MESATLLNFVPDYVSEDPSKWIEETKQKINVLTHQEALEAKFDFLDWSQIAQERDVHMGLFRSCSWRKFVTTVFLADLLSYPTPVDQVDFGRLCLVMDRFPQGFRTWWVQLKDSSWCPVGYTGWYPMDETKFLSMKESPATLKDRMVSPISLQNNPYLYLFNYSVASNFKKTPLSRALVTLYAQDIHAQNPQGLSCITVSEDGARIAERFGMKHAGNFQIEDSIEGVYTT